MARSTRGTLRLLGRHWLAAMVVTLSTVGAITTTASASARPHTSSAVVDEVQGPFGPMLVAGSGPDQGLALYAITSDNGSSYGCPATPTTYRGPGGTQTQLCTGPENDSNAEWPAYTTVGVPTAGDGVNQDELGYVSRARVGNQVTYNGHPLYLFDIVPGIVSGVNWDESVLPPWHGLWYLMSPSGAYLPGSETLTTTTDTAGTGVLAATVTVGGGTLDAPVYTYSNGADCTGACAVTWPPVIASGSPGIQGNAKSSDIGSITLANGDQQVTYDGQPLYIYSGEAPSLATGYATYEANGNGLAGPEPYGGTFSDVPLRPSSTPAVNSPPYTGKSTAAVVDVLDGPYGPMLIAGSGPSAGTALYAISSDVGGKFGCTTKPSSVLGSPITCTGDASTEWPAYTTTAPPIAGRGIRGKLLSTVERPGIGEQVTYNGHPLYLFDSIPGLPTGEAWDEATLPAWHGVWNLLSPNGNFLAPAETIGTVLTTNGHLVLAAIMSTGAGQTDFPLYSDSAGKSCVGNCLRVFSPLLTSGMPALLDGLSSSNFGNTRLANGETQVTYLGHPLYLFGGQSFSLNTGTIVPTTNGNGQVVPPAKGTFSVVKPL